MSVAFRRDGDEEHLEPKFEIPIPPGPNRVTARGLALIGARVAELESRIAALSEDAAITAAKRDLRYWQTRQVTAQLVPPASGDTADFGTRVTFRHKGKERTITIVGDDEADPANGLIAFSAPLARALTGAEVGEWLAFAGQEDALEVLAIKPVEQR
jgi:transcription elongation GreA/GreB family factor